MWSSDIRLLKRSLIDQNVCPVHCLQEKWIGIGLCYQHTIVLTYRSLSCVGFLLLKSNLCVTFLFPLTRRQQDHTISLISPYNVRMRLVRLNDTSLEGKLHTWGTPQTWFICFCYADNDIILDLKRKRRVLGNCMVREVWNEWMRLHFRFSKRSWLLVMC